MNFKIYGDFIGFLMMEDILELYLDELIRYLNKLKIKNVFEYNYCIKVFSLKIKDFKINEYSNIFTWRDSEQGFDFWAEFNKKWVAYLTNQSIEDITIRELI